MHADTCGLKSIFLMFEAHKPPSLGHDKQVMEVMKDSEIGLNKGTYLLTGWEFKRAPATAAVAYMHKFTAELSQKFKESHLALKPHTFSISHKLVCRSAQITTCLII